MTPRCTIFAEIETERGWQLVAHSESRDNQHSHEDWLALLVHYAARTMGESPGDRIDPDVRRRNLMKVAALSVAAIEAHDRQYPRVAGSEPTGSGW